MLTDEQIRSLTYSEFQDLFFRLGQEDRRRNRILREEELLNQTQIAVQEEQGVVHEEGEEWTQPQGVHDAYLLAGIVSHNGKLWESLTPYNVWEPGVSGWREIPSEEGEVPGEGGQVPEFLQPTGAHDAYSEGDEVMFEGQHYVSLIDGNVWSPLDYPAGWAEVVQDAQPEG